jgi:hypothetical protein
MNKDLEQATTKELSKLLSDAVDFESIADIMVKHGWIKVEIDRYTDNHHAIDMKIWAENHCERHYKSYGRTWVFENEQEALWFKLKWQR